MAGKVIRLYVPPKTFFTPNPMNKDLGSPILKRRSVDIAEYCHVEGKVVLNYGEDGSWQIAQVVAEGFSISFAYASERDLELATGFQKTARTLGISQRDLARLIYYNSPLADE